MQLFKLEKEHPASESLPLAGGKKGPQVESVASGGPAAPELNLAQTLRTLEFWLLFACFSVVAGAGLLVNANLAQIAQALHLGEPGAAADRLRDAHCHCVAEAHAGQGVPVPTLPVAFFFRATTSLTWRVDCLDIHVGWIGSGR